MTATTIKLKDIGLPCRECGQGNLFEPADTTDFDSPLVRCEACGFVGRRTNLIVVPDRSARRQMEAATGNATEKSNAEVAASLTQEVLSRFESLLEDVDIVKNERYKRGRPAYPLEHECESISQQDVFFGILTILKELATKGPIAIVDAPEPDDIDVAMTGVSTAKWTCPPF